MNIFQGGGPLFFSPQLKFHFSDVNALRGSQLLSHMVVESETTM